MTTVLEAPALSRPVPWLGAGTDVSGALTVEEAAERSGLNFDVELRRTAYEDEHGEWKINPERRHIYRVGMTGPKGIIGISSRDYEPVQYGEAFAFMNAVSPHFVAAGPLRDGKQGFIVVQAADDALRHLDLELRGEGDKLGAFVALRTSHDLSRGIEISALMLRFTCINQITGPALARGAQWRWSIRHVRGAKEQLHQAQRVFTNLNVFRDHFANTAEILARIELTIEEAREVVTQAYSQPRARPKTPETVERILGAWQSSDTVGFFPSGWGLLNAVGEDVDWIRHRTKAGGERKGDRHEARFLGALQGSNLRYTNRVAHLLLRKHG